MGDYVDIGPVHMWYETRGEGEPLVLLHGGLDSNAAWVGQFDALAKHFRVVAPERRGHGHTPDVEGPISYQVMAEDAAAFIDKVVGSPVHLVGWSDGAILSIIVALMRPDLVRKLVLIGGDADVSAYVPQFLEATRLPADSDVYQPFRAIYEAHHAAICAYFARRAPRDEVEDLAAETFTVAWRKLSRVQVDMVHTASPTNSGISRCRRGKRRRSA